MFVALSLPQALYVVAILFLVLTPPAVTVLKGHFVLFAAGFFTVGLVWVIAEFRLARPNSPWAGWFYDADEMRRSWERYPAVSREDRDGTITVVAVVLGIVGVLVLAGFASALFS